MDNIREKLDQLSAEMRIAVRLNIEHDLNKTIFTLQMEGPYLKEPLYTLYAALLGIKLYQAHKANIKPLTELKHENKISKILSHNRKEYSNNGS